MPPDVRHHRAYDDDVSVDRKDATVSWPRSLVVVLLTGFFSVFAGAAWDHEWPQHSAQWWLVFIAGLLVIAVITTVAESVYLAQRREADDRTS